MNVENSPDHVLPTPAVLDMIYGHSDGDLGKFLEEGSQGYAQHFLRLKAQDWIRLVKETFSGEDRVL